MPTITTITSGQAPASFEWGPYNAWFNQDGSVRFFVARDLTGQTSAVTVYRPNGSWVGELSLGGIAYPQLGIIPKPGTCNEFYLLRIGSFPSGNTAVAYYTLTTTTSSTGWSLNGPTYLLGAQGQTQPTNNMAMAIGKPRSNGESWIYLSNEVGGIQWLNVSASGISHLGTLSNLPTSIPSTDYKTHQLKLSDAGDALAWGVNEGSNNAAKVYLMSLGTDGDYAG